MVKKGISIRRSLKLPDAYKNLIYKFDGLPGVQSEKVPTKGVLKCVFAPGAIFWITQEVMTFLDNVQFVVFCFVDKCSQRDIIVPTGDLQKIEISAKYISYIVQVVNGIRYEVVGKFSINQYIYIYIYVANSGTSRSTAPIMLKAQNSRCEYAAIIWFISIALFEPCMPLYADSATFVIIGIALLV